MTESSEVRVVLFDIGGVLVELSGVQALLSWLGNRMTPDEVFALWLRSPAVRLFETGQIAAEPFAEQIIAELSLVLTPEEFLHAFCSWTRGLLPGALELVECVPRRYIRATLSNTNILQWPCLMNEMKLDRAFDHHFASHLTGKIKPDEEAFQNVADVLDCRAGSILFLDDNRLNVEAAARVGLRAVQVRGPAQAKQALIHAGVIGA